MIGDLMIDMFGGFGGVALAAQRLGFSVVSIDNDPVCTRMAHLNLGGEERILRNPPPVKCVEMDLLRVPVTHAVRRLGVEQKDVRWLHGSPECQDHSRAGRHDPNGPGHKMLLRMSAWAGFFPDAHLTIENVVGVQNSRAWPRMIKGLIDQGRDVRTYTVNATWYGVPQYRERVWVCAGPVGKDCIPVPAPTVSLHRPRTFAWAMLKPCAIEDVDSGRGRNLTDYQRRLAPHVESGETDFDITDPDTLEWLHDMYPGRRSGCFVRRLRMDVPVYTVPTAPDINMMARFVHPSEDRLLSVREWARLQSFPDEYRFECAMAAAYRGIGNAVPPPMAQVFGREILRAIDSQARPPP